MDILKRIKITSDGTPQGTRVTDMETGKSLPAMEVDWHMDMQNIPTAVVKVPAMIETETGAKILTLCAGCRKEWDEPALVQTSSLGDEYHSHAVPPKPEPLKPVEYVKGRWPPKR